MKEFCKVAGVKRAPAVPSERLTAGHTLFWPTDAKRATIVKAERAISERTRHSRKYVEGHLGPHSFFFRGRDKKLNLRAHNLCLFLLLADGVDDDTWSFHLRNGEYSKWFRDNVKDPELAEAAEQVERDAQIDPAASRAAIRGEIEKRYTLPSDEPSGVID